MIICKTPYRIPLAGGGTDLDFYYKKKGGFLISSTINQYIYTCVTERTTDEKILIQTTSTQFASNVDQIKHRMIKTVLKHFSIKNKITVGTYSTLPTGVDLGSSSATIIGLINCLKELLNIKISNKEIVKKAFYLERNLLKIDGGWQDQIISTYGGIKKIEINKNGSYRFADLKINKSKIKNFEKYLLLIYTNVTRDSSKIIKSQRKNKNKIIKTYDQIKNLAYDFENLIKKERYKEIGELFHHHWMLKRKLSNNMTNSYLDKIYLNLLKEKSFVGGKIIGAGGGGFFLMVSSNMKKSISYLKKKKLNFLNFSFDNLGSRVIEK